MNYFSIHVSSISAPLVMNIPHSSPYIPPLERSHLLLTDDSLSKFVDSATDWYTSDIFSPILIQGGSALVAEVSRVVLDTERYEDDQYEPQAAKGLGVIYSRTYDGEQLRGAISTEERSRLLNTYYYPYHEALAQMVSDSLSEFNGCFLMDCHSFSGSQPHEPKEMREIPDICIGTDESHTSPTLKTALIEVVKDAGFTVACDFPYQGCLIPTSHSGDVRVQGAMIEVNKSVYLSESLELIPEKAEMLTECIAQLGRVGIAEIAS